MIIICIFFNYLSCIFIKKKIKVILEEKTFTFYFWIYKFKNFNDLFKINSTLILISFNKYVTITEDYICLIILTINKI